MEPLGALAEVAQKSDRVLVLGQWVSDAVNRLHHSGYSNLYALSPDRAVYGGPHNKKVRYVYGNPTRTHFPSNFFTAVLISEGRAGASQGLMPEAWRVTADGGVVVSQGTHTRVTKTGPVPLNEVDILFGLEGRGGISEYTRVMRDRIVREWGVTARIARTKAEVEAQSVIVQFENGLPNAERIILDSLDLAASGHTVYFDVHAAFSDFGVWNGYLPELEANTRMLYRANEVAEADGVEDYSLLPHLSYRNVPELAARRERVRLGSFGFASRGKRHEDLIYMARRLRVPLTLLLSVNTEVSEKVAEDMRRYIASLQRLAGDGIEIIDGFFSYEEIEARLARCSHLIFTTKSALSNSGSIQFAKRMNKPILSLASFQAQQAQVHQFDSLTDRRTAVGRQLLSISSRIVYAVRERPETTARVLRSLFTRERRAVALGVGTQLLGDLCRAVSSNRMPISRAFIDEHVELSRDEDGLEYLYHSLRFPERGPSPSSRLARSSVVRTGERE